MDIPITMLIILISILLTCSFILTKNYRAQKSGSLPPGPLPFPIIGNILSVGSNPARSFAVLSRKYGPLMSLKLGTRTTIVISSSDVAKVLFLKHDASISSRTIPASLEAMDVHKDSLTWQPVGNQWRKLRKILKDHIFSAIKLETDRGIRQDKVRKLHAYVKECCMMGRSVNIGEATFTAFLNLLSTTLFSREFASFNSGIAKDTKDVVFALVKCAGKPNISDYFPALKCVDPQGVSRETKFYFNKMFEVFDAIIEEKMKSGLQKINDLTDVLLDINRRNDEDVSLNEIKHLLMDLFVAGSDTISGTTEWAMAELMRNPDKMSTARAEIREMVGENVEIQESDIARLPYLQAIVKETLRLHPAGPFLIPRKAETDIDINGHVIPKDAQIIVNVWAIGRDPTIWPDAESFMPERFLQSHVETNYKGRNFELIPFGAGRRICAGLPLADCMLPLMMGTLIHGFGWKPEDGIEPEDIDMSEHFGLGLQMAKPLRAIPGF